MKHIQRKWIVIFALIIAVAVMAAFTLRGGDKPVYATQRVQQGDIRQLVQATGTIDAVTTVQVGSQISGTILKLNADFNTKVKKGQVVAEIELGRGCHNRVDSRGKALGLAGIKATIKSLGGSRACILLHLQQMQCQLFLQSIKTIER